MQERLSQELKEPIQGPERKESLGQYLHAVNILAKEIARTFVIAGLGFVPMQVEGAQEDNSATAILEEKGSDYYQKLAKKHRLSSQFGKDVMADQLGLPRYIKESTKKINWINSRIKALTEALEKGVPYVEKEQDGVLPEEKQKEELRVEDIPTLDGTMKGEYLTRILQETYPKNWIDAEVRLIEFKDDNYVSEYTRHGKNEKDWEAIGLFSSGSEEERGVITLFSPMKSMSMSSVLSCVTHEVAHANDWFNNIDMNDNERADFLRRIGLRIKATNRYKSVYVESIRTKNGKITNILRAQEYFAEIVSQALEDPSKLPFEDFELVLEVVGKKDPTFDFIASAKKRREMLAEISIPKTIQ